jgi:AAA+ superfamily predicted ATPase
MNHGILADELFGILNNGNGGIKKTTSIFNQYTPKDNNKEIPLFELIYPEKYFADLVISEDKKEQVQQIIKEFSNWDILVCNGVFPSNKVLFYGPPGCGKTLSSQVIASEMGIPMIYVRFDALVSSFLGETASNIRKIFDYAKTDNYVIFFDEFDAIGRSRNDQFEHGEIKRVVNAFLQQLDNFKGRSLIIAATNFEQSLDYALWRRFNETICFSMPTDKEKEELFKIKLQRFDGPIHIVNEYMLNMSSFSHSDIDQVCQTIMKNCILNGKKIYGKKDIELAVLKQERVNSLRKTEYIV